MCPECSLNVGLQVVVDKDTVFTSLVFNSSSIPDLPSSFPREIMAWTEGLYRPAFTLPTSTKIDSISFALREHGAYALVLVCFVVFGWFQVFLVRTVLGTHQL
jgi:hypothetical protein